MIRTKFTIPGNTAQLYFRILDYPDDPLLIDYPELWGNIWISTFDNLEQGNGHGRELLDELQKRYPGMSLNLHPAPSSRLREYYKRIGFNWDCSGRYMVKPAAHGNSCNPPGT